MTAPMHVPAFTVAQKITMMVNRYEIHAAGPDGRPGQLMAFAQQKRMAMKEEVTFYTDSTKSQPLFSFRARKRLDLGSGYDVRDEAGNPLGYFKKEFGASLMRSTFVVEGPGFSGRGQERNQVVAFLRRFTELDFLPVHFDFVDPEGHTLMSSNKQWAMRDRYQVSVPDPRVDFRFAAAMAVALDVLMAR